MIVGAQRRSRAEGWLSKIEERLSRVEGSIKALRAEVKEVAGRVNSLDDKVGWIERSVSRRLRDDWIGCKYVDEGATARAGGGTARWRAGT